jgi:tetratricopeptide (TPR) repeat protein
MAIDESRRIFAEAVELYDNGDYNGALALFDIVERDLPNSRHINFHRALCLVKVGRIEEAKRCQRKLEGRIKAQDFQHLSRAIENAGLSDHDAEYEDDPISENLFTVKAVYPISGEECSVTGIVKKGVFRTGDTAYALNRASRRVPALIVRIGPADTPLLLARQGQQAMMLLRIKPDKISPGDTLVYEAQISASDATMTVKSNACGKTIIMECPEDLAPIEKMIKRGYYFDAEKSLSRYIVRNPENIFAKRMLAQVYLDDGSPLQDTIKALDLIRTVYQEGGSEDPTVINILAHAYAESGNPEEGLEALEHLYTLLHDVEAKRALLQRIDEFRMAYDLGELWEFADSYGEIIFKSYSGRESVRAIMKGVIPLDTTCRHNGLGDFSPLATSFAPLFPEVAALIKSKTQKQWTPGFIALLVILVLGILLTVLLPVIL